MMASPAHASGTSRIVIAMGTLPDVFQPCMQCRSEGLPAVGMDVAPANLKCWGTMFPVFGGPRSTVEKHLILIRNTQKPRGDSSFE